MGGLEGETMDETRVMAVRTWTGPPWWPVLGVSPSLAVARHHRKVPNVFSVPQLERQQRKLLTFEKSTCKNPGKCNLKRKHPTKRLSRNNYPTNKKSNPIFSGKIITQNVATL
jgi:hypothetical protein